MKNGRRDRRFEDSRRSFRIEALEFREQPAVAMPAVDFAAGDFSLTDRKSGPFASVEFGLEVLANDFLGFQNANPDDWRDLSYTAPDSSMRTANQLVLVDAVATGDGSAFEDSLAALSVTDYARASNVFSAWVPMEFLAELANSEHLAFARASRSTSSVGQTTSQAVEAQDVADARTSFGVDGSGVKVGVLSDSFDSLLGADSDVASGDLPADFEVLVDIAGGTDEGRAMAQLITDVAPGADIAFRTAFLGQADFANGIRELADAGSDIIVDDILYFAEPMFQDGIIAQAVNEVSAQGIPYFSSAGNSGRNSYEASFRNSGVPIRIGFSSAGIAHDFDPGPGVDILQRITVTTGSSVTISLQWDSPFLSADPFGGGSVNDLDFFLVDSTSTIVASSTSNNIGGDAVEILSFTNTGPIETFDLLITSFAGPEPGFLKYVYFETGSVTIDEFDTQSSTLYGHANAASAAAVGAAFFAQTPAFGVDPPILESFSSAGGTPILFDGFSQSIVEDRPGPRFTAADGTNTTFFGVQINDGDNFPNFFGTSAAAPHAAAVAALALEADPTLLPEEIFAAFAASALDIGTPGFDLDSGAGLIQAEAALELLLDEEAVDPPIVTDVFLSGSAWSPEFFTSLENAGLGDEEFGLRIPTGSVDQFEAVLQSNVDTFSIRFDEEVDVATDAFSITGLAGVEYRIDDTFFEWDAITLTATWRLDASVTPFLLADTVRLTLESVAVTDNDGLRLDGEWVDGISSVSGSGAPGGDFRFVVNVLPGDFDRSGAVTISDLIEVATQLNLGATDSGFDPRADSDGSGVITITDLVNVATNLNATLPISEFSNPETLTPTRIDEIFDQATTSANDPPPRRLRRMSSGGEESVSNPLL